MKADDTLKLYLQHIFVIVSISRSQIRIFVCVEIMIHKKKYLLFKFNLCEHNHLFTVHINLQEDKRKSTQTESWLDDINVHNFFCKNVKGVSCSVSAREK